MKKRGQGEGTVFVHKSGAVVGKLSLGKGPDGKRKRKEIWCPPGTPLAEVRRRLRDLQHQLDNGKTLPTAKGTVGAYLEEWLAFLRQENRLRPRTLAGYEGHTRRYLIPGLGHIKLAKLGKKDVQTFLNARQPRPAEGRKGRSVDQLSARTMHHCRAILRTALEQAVDWELISSNPAAGNIRGPKVKQTEARYLTTDEAKRLLVALDGERLGPLFVTMIVTGMRPSEAYGLQWQHVDLDTGVVRVRASLEYDRAKKEHRLAELKTERSKRDLPLPRPALEALRAHKLSQNEEKMAFRKEWREAPLPDLVFTSRHGRPLDDAHVRRTLRALCEKAAVGPVTPYALRHSCASLLIAQGEHPRVVMGVLGHSQIALTMNTYGHVAPELHLEAARKIGSALFDE